MGRCQRPDDQRNAPDVPGNADVLSDVLAGVRLTGAMFFLVEAAAPWVTSAPAAAVFSPAVLPGSRHLISYHMITQGTCWGGIEGAAPMRLEAGDVLVIPHGDPYYLANPADATDRYSPEEATRFFRQMAAGELSSVVTEGGGGPERTSFICGFLGCDARPFNPVLSALPPVLRLRGTLHPDARMKHLIELALCELRERGAGSREVLLRLSELMFIAVVRHCLDTESTDRSGWLAGMRDPVVARVLSLVHAAPQHGWTIEALAARAGTSRSVLADRFTRIVGQPPMQYLACWRMQLATRLLRDRAAKLRSVAQAVGYDSEAAFSRAFKKAVGETASQWRQRHQ